MKKITLLLVLSILTLNFSCSKSDDPDVSKNFTFKVSIDVPTENDIELTSTVIGASANNNEKFKNLITQDQTYPLRTDLTTGNHQFESLNKIYGFNLTIEANTETGDNDTTIGLKVFRDNKLIYDENITFGPAIVETKIWNYVNGEVILVSN